MLHVGVQRNLGTLFYTLDSEAPELTVWEPLFWPGDWVFYEREVYTSIDPIISQGCASHLFIFISIKSQKSPFFPDKKTELRKVRCEVTQGKRQGRTWFSIFSYSVTLPWGKDHRWSSLTVRHLTHGLARKRQGNKWLKPGQPYPMHSQALQLVTRVFGQRPPQRQASKGVPHTSKNETRRWAQL